MAFLGRRPKLVRMLVLTHMACDAGGSRAGLQGRAEIGSRATAGFGGGRQHAAQEAAGGGILGNPFRLGEGGREVPRLLHKVGRQLLLLLRVRLMLVQLLKVQLLLLLLEPLVQMLLLDDSSAQELHR